MPVSFIALCMKKGGVAGSKSSAQNYLTCPFFFLFFGRAAYIGTEEDGEWVVFGVFG